jgi:hypothetical protein
MNKYHRHRRLYARNQNGHATERDYQARKANEAMRAWLRGLPPKHHNAVKFASAVPISISVSS